MKKIAIKGSLELQKAFCKESEIDYWQDWDNRDYSSYPNLSTDVTERSRFSGCTDAWIECHPEYTVFNLPSQWDEALEYVLHGGNPEVKFGDFTAEIDKEAKFVNIAGRGALTFSQCNRIYDKIKSENIGYDIKLNITSIDFGCVKNIPIADVLNVIKLINE